MEGLLRISILASSHEPAKAIDRFVSDHSRSATLSAGEKISFFISFVDESRYHAPATTIGYSTGADDARNLATGLGLVVFVDPHPLFLRAGFALEDPSYKIAIRASRMNIVFRAHHE